MDFREIFAYSVEASGFDRISKNFPSVHTTVYCLKNLAITAVYSYFCRLSAGSLIVGTQNIFERNYGGFAWSTDVYHSTMIDIHDVEQGNNNPRQ